MDAMDSGQHLSREEMKKLRFVCTANVCRSPMAAALFNAFFPLLRTTGGRLHA